MRLPHPMTWLFLLPLATTAAPAAMPLPDATYVYSDFCAGSKGWDIAGHRVEFRHAPNGGDEVIIEFDEWGGDSEAIEATPVHFDPATGALNFSYQTQLDDYTFDGTVTPDELVGTFEYDLKPTHLPRVAEHAPIRARCPVSAQQR